MKFYEEDSIELVRELSPAEKKIINKFKKHTEKSEDYEDKLIPIKASYAREQELIKAKYMKLLAILQASKMEEDVYADICMEEFWDKFDSSYEDNPDELILNVDDYSVYRVIAPDTPSKPNTVAKDRQVYMDDKWFKNLILGDEPEDTEDEDER